SANPAGLAAVLREEESWARKYVPNYAPRPTTLAFAPHSGTGAELRARFIDAVRINPSSRLSLFLQLPPGKDANGVPLLTEADITPLKTSEATKFDSFVSLREGEPVAPLDVIATATDEPDYGMDIGLWSDNGTVHGKRYGFGNQPFGNPAVEYSSQ